MTREEFKKEMQKAYGDNFRYSREYYRGLKLFDHFEQKEAELRAEYQKKISEINLEHDKEKINKMEELISKLENSLTKSRQIHNNVEIEFINFRKKIFNFRNNLNTLKWIGTDEGWNIAISKVQEELDKEFYIEDLLANSQGNNSVHQRTATKKE